MKSLVIVACVFAIILLIYQAGGGGENRSREAMHQWVRSMKVYPEYAEYLDKLVDDHHPAAYRWAFSTPAKMEQTISGSQRLNYVNQLFSAMMKQCAADDKSNLVKHLRKLRDRKLKGNAFTEW